VESRISNFTDFHPRDDKGLTSLHVAAAQGQLEICRWMIYSLTLNNVIDINPRNHEGTTPLHLAVMNGQIEVWKFMAIIVIYAITHNSQPAIFFITGLAAQKAHFGQKYEFYRLSVSPLYNLLGVIIKDSDLKII
jgi:hypothetical protein